MSFWETFFAAEAGKKTSEKIFSYNNGVLAYIYAAKVFILCGIGWGLFGIPAVIYQNVYWLWIVGAVYIIVGTVLLTLCKKSKKFQEWAKKDFIKDKERVSKPSKKRDMIVIGVAVATMVILYGVLFIV